MVVAAGRFTIVLACQKAQDSIKPSHFLARELKILTTSEILGSWGKVCHASYAKVSVSQNLALDYLLFGYVPLNTLIRNFKNIFSTTFIYGMYTNY